jgi:hypothetical protein
MERAKAAGTDRRAPGAVAGTAGCEYSKRFPSAGAAFSTHAGRT